SERAGYTRRASLGGAVSQQPRRAAAVYHAGRYARRDCTAALEPRLGSQPKGESIGACEFGRQTAGVIVYGWQSVGVVVRSAALWHRARRQVRRWPGRAALGAGGLCVV